MFWIGLIVGALFASGIILSYIAYAYCRALGSREDFRTIVEAVITATDKREGQAIVYPGD